MEKMQCSKSILATLIVWWNFKIGSLYKSWDIEKNEGTEAFQMFATTPKSKDITMNILGIGRSCGDRLKMKDLDLLTVKLTNWIWRYFVGL